MKNAITSSWLIASAFWIAGCAKPVYIAISSDERVILVNKGDKLIRSNYQPNEVEIPWDGVLLSDGEHRRLLDSEEDWIIHKENTR